MTNYKTQLGFKTTVPEEQLVDTFVKAFDDAPTVGGVREAAFGVMPRFVRDRTRSKWSFERVDGSSLHGVDQTQIVATLDGGYGKMQWAAGTSMVLEFRPGHGGFEGVVAVLDTIRNTTSTGLSLGNQAKSLLTEMMRRLEDRFTAIATEIAHV